jgi:5-methylcytosine-specific restriction enzyme A
LKLAHSPLCSVCYAAGRHVAAKDVDHLDPHDGPSDPLFWLWENLDSKCHSCHSRKTATTDSTFANRRDSNATSTNRAHTAWEVEKERGHNPEAHG